MLNAFNSDQFTLLVYEMDQGSSGVGTLMSLDRNTTNTANSWL